MIKVAISTGHSKKDGGCVGLDGTREYNLNVPIVEQIIMHGLGDKAQFVRVDVNADELPYPEHCWATKDFINDAGDFVCCVEIHHNSVIRNDVKGAEIIYISQKGKWIGSYVYDEMIKIRNKVRLIHLKETGRKNYFLKYTDPPALIVEPTYLSNWEDLQLAKDKWKEFAKAIRDGIYNWLKHAGEI